MVVVDVDGSILQVDLTAPVSWLHMRMSSRLPLSRHPSNELLQWLCYDNVDTNTGRLFRFTGVHLLECCHVDDTSPNHTVVGLPQGRVDLNVGQMYNSIDVPQPGGTWGPSRSSPIKW